ncbi:hypothetical protein L6164_010561 [Bauhinia variegata]|uniref:Uncharacterized protein n=1 Tax=Bauhinia variegata TaxID=167791 RepID=A0ACB9PNM8_BAUVA|nr:hypothetical protein L6164_010561 [Bauhinia variegata]
MGGLRIKKDYWWTYVMSVKPIHLLVRVTQEIHHALILCGFFGDHSKLKTYWAERYSSELFSNLYNFLQLRLGLFYWEAPPRHSSLTRNAEKMDPRRLQADSIPIFREGIGLVLYRWSSLRTAVENEWGGRESRRKAEQLGNDVLSWFTQSKEPLYIDDLEQILDDGMLSLNVEVDDGSIEEVSEKLMIMHEECLEGDFRSVETLRQAALMQTAPSHVPKIVDDNEDSDDDDDEDEDNTTEDDDSSKMKVDEPQSESNLNSVNLVVNGPSQEVTAEPDDEWIVVSNRRSKGRKN